MPKTKPKTLPAALVKRAAALTRQKLARIVKEARADIALLRRRRGDIAGAFYDMGEALRRLKRPEVLLAFKRATWESFCQAELTMSESQAERLIDIVNTMTREDAIKLGTFSKASSVARLVQATPADETVAQAIREGVVVGKARLDVKHASVRAIAKATRGVPRARDKRGRHVSDSDAATVAKLEHELRKQKLDAHVIAKAGLAGKEARVTIDVAISGLAALARVLSKR